MGKRSGEIPHPYFLRREQILEFYWINTHRSDGAGAVWKVGAWITHCMLGKELFYLREDEVQKGKREVQARGLEAYGEGPSAGCCLIP